MRVVVIFLILCGVVFLILPLAFADVVSIAKLPQFWLSNPGMAVWDVVACIVFAFWINFEFSYKKKV